MERTSLLGEEVKVAFALLLPALYCWPAAKGKHLTGCLWPHTETTALEQSATLNLIHGYNKKQFCKKANFLRNRRRVYCHLVRILETALKSWTLKNNNKITN